MKDFVNGEELFQRSVQISNGLRETSADGCSLAFDKKYGITFCSYMPGKQGKYGESRGRVALSYFPATQPTNIRFVTVAEGHDEYCNNILSLGDGKVRIFYEKDSYLDGDHEIAFRDFDFIEEKLGEEKIMRFTPNGLDGGALCLSGVFSFIEERGYRNHRYLADEQISIGGSTFFKGEDGLSYGAVTSYYSEVVLVRSHDGMASVEPFAVFPYPVQYEFDYKFLNGKIYAIFRTDKKRNSICFSFSEDMGKSWSEPVELQESIACRPRIISYGDTLLMCYNYFNDAVSRAYPMPSGRTAVKMRLVDCDDPNKCTLVADIFFRYGLVNASVMAVSDEIYLGFSTSLIPLQCLNYGGEDPHIHGKDAIRFVRLGQLKGEEK